MTTEGPLQKSRASALEPICPKPLVYIGPTTPTWRLESSPHQSASNPSATNNWTNQRLRSKSQQPRQTYSYDPVADMEILDRWNTQRKQPSSSCFLRGLEGSGRSETVTGA